MNLFVKVELDSNISSTVTEEVSLQKVFKDLENKLQDVHKISIKNREKVIDLSLRDQEWVLTNRNNFIASQEVVCLLYTSDADDE